MRASLIVLVALLDALCVLDTLQGAVLSADGPLVQGWLAGGLHAAAFLLTALASQFLSSTSKDGR